MFRQQQFSNGIFFLLSLTLKRSKQSKALSGMVLFSAEASLNSKESSDLKKGQGSRVWNWNENKILIFS